VSVSHRYSSGQEGCRDVLVSWYHLEGCFDPTMISRIIRPHLTLQADEATTTMRTRRTKTTSTPSTPLRRSTIPRHPFSFLVHRLFFSTNDKRTTINESDTSPKVETPAAPRHRHRSEGGIDTPFILTILTEMLKQNNYLKKNSF